jgi:hypothetical protein
VTFEQLASNVVRVYLEVGSRRAHVLYSYDTPVVVWVSRLGRFVIDQAPTRTTAKHINQWEPRHPGHLDTKVSEAVLRAMVASIGFEAHAFIAALEHVDLPDDVRVGLDVLLEGK